MSGGMKLFTSMVRMTLRNKQSIFWSLFFPVLFMMAMGFTGDREQKVRLAIVQTDESAMAQTVVQALQNIPVFEITEVAGLPEAEQAVSKDKLDAAVVISDRFGQDLAAAMDGSKPAVLDVLYNNANYVEAHTTQGVLNSVLKELGLSFGGIVSPLQANMRPIGAERMGYLDFVVPGLLAMMIMNSSLFSIGMAVSTWREKGVLKRLRATTLSSGTLVASMVGNQMITGLVSVLIVILLAVLAFHANLHLAVGPIAVLVFLGSAVFFSLGFFISGLAKGSESIPPLMNIVSLPMMFLSGVFFPVDSLPQVLQTVVGFFPLTFLVEGLRDVMNLGASWSALGRDLIGLSVWAVIIVFGTTRTFRWE